MSRVFNLAFGAP